MSKHANSTPKDHKNEASTAEKAQESRETAEGTPAVNPGESAAKDDCMDVNIELEAKIASLEGKVKAQDEEISSLKDQYLRKVADYENFRKRMFKEKEDALKFANSNLLVDLIEVIDNFDRAVQSAEQGKDFQNFHDGIVMLQKQMLSMLESKYGLKRFDSKGEEFDPFKHEALMREERDDIDQAVVSDDFMKGYLLHDRVVRTAKVKVAMPKAKDTAGDQGEDDAGKE